MNDVSVTESLLPDPVVLLRPGSTLGAYELLCMIAQGGMGAVWAARRTNDLAGHDLVAIKTILPQIAKSSSYRKMFMDEARIALLIVHPNVVPVLEIGEHDGIMFQVLEWVRGDSLHVLTQTTNENGLRMPAAFAIQLMIQAARGLHAAHELRDNEGRHLHVIHRDISPQNIMVSLSGIARITDFGVAKSLNRMASETSTGNVKGKLHYMAPEQAMGDQVARTADIWSLGAVLYELLTGHRPYEAPSSLALLTEIATAPPTLLFDTPLDPRIIGVVRRALSRSPEGRHSTASEFADNLDRAASASGMTATETELASFCSNYLSARSELRLQAIESCRAYRHTPTPIENPEGPFTLPTHFLKPEHAHKSETADLELKFATGSITANTELPTTRFPRKMSARALWILSIPISAVVIFFVSFITIHNRNQPLANSGMSATQAPELVPPPRSSSVELLPVPAPTTEAPPVASQPSTALRNKSPATGKSRPAPAPARPPRFEVIDDGF